MPPDELRSAVEWEASDRMDLDAQTYRIQYFDAGEVRQGEEMREEIILVAAAVHEIDEHVELLKRLKLEPQAIDAVPGALARLIERQDGGGDDAPIRVVLDIGYSSSKVMICRGGRVLFFKLIDIGGRKLDETVAGRLSVSAEEASNVRRKSNGDDGGLNQQINEQASAEAYGPLVSELAREVGLCLRYYSVTFRGERPHDLIVVGGESSLPQLQEMLVAGTGTQVSGLKPGFVEGIDGLDGTVGSWAVALGLAMRQPSTRAARKEAA